MATRKRTRDLFPVKFRSQIKLEGRLYGIIATIDFFYRENENGALSPDLYYKRIRALTGEALQARIKLEKLGGFDFQSFIANSDIERDYRHGLNQLLRADGQKVPGQVQIESKGDEPVALNYGQLKDLPSTAVDFIVASIELTDLIRLELATIERVLPLLDEMMHGLETVPIFQDDYWALVEIKDWIKRLNKERASMEIKGSTLEKLGLQAERWFNDFRRQIRSMK